MAANDNSRPTYRRKPPVARFPSSKRQISAWEVDSALSPDSERGQQIVAEA